MSSSRVKKENIIILPNKDKLPTGKIKEVDKFLNIVSAEYNIEDDMGYFTIVKEKCEYAFKLHYIPREVSELHSITAKKFVLYELIRIGQDCVIKTDDELNKRSNVINDMLNQMDDTCKETITSKLNTMFDIPGELDYLLDQMLTDPQYNSFKYSVLDEKRSPHLLCVSGDGLFVRSTVPPYEVTKQVSWQDIDVVKSKANKLCIRKKNDTTEEIACTGRKTSLTACVHIQQYMTFLGNRDSADTRKAKGNWLGSLAVKLRQSFSKRAKSHDHEGDGSVRSDTLAKSASTLPRRNAPPNTKDKVDHRDTAEDTCAAVRSTQEPSVGSGSSFEHCASFADQLPYTGTRPSDQEDHMSVKTTSTYEVSVEGAPSQRNLSTSIRNDPDLATAITNLASFGQNVPIKSGVQMSNERRIMDEVLPPPSEQTRVTRTIDTKVVAVPPPAPPVRTCETRGQTLSDTVCPQYDPVKLPPPPPPVRTIGIEVQDSLESGYICPPREFVSAASEPIPRRDVVATGLSMKVDPPRRDVVATELSVKVDPPRRDVVATGLSVKVDLPMADIVADEDTAVIDTPMDPVTTIADVQDEDPQIVSVPECPDNAAILDRVNDSPLAMHTQSTAIIDQEHSPTTQRDAEIPPVLDRSTEDLKMMNMHSTDIIYPHETAAINDDIMLIMQDFPPLLPSEYQMTVSNEDCAVMPMPPDDGVLSVHEERQSAMPSKTECKLPVRKSIPSPKVQRPSRIPAVSSPRDPVSPHSPTSSSIPVHVQKAPSPSDKENYNSSMLKNAPSTEKNTGSDHRHDLGTREANTVTVTALGSGDGAIRRTSKSDAPPLKTSGIPAPKQYKPSAAATATVPGIKKSSDAPRSPVLGGPRVSGIPRMSSK